MTSVVNFYNLQELVEEVLANIFFQFTTKAVDYGLIESFNHSITLWAVCSCKKIIDVLILQKSDERFRTYAGISVG